MRLTSSRAAICALTLASMLTVAAPAPAERYTAGSPGLGDELFPNAGNGGYDVQHYDLALDYDPASDRLDGRAVITATATQDLDQFNLDLRDFADILKLEVNGHAARFRFEGGAMTLQALRQKIGDADFFELLQTWYARHKYGNASTEDFIALAEEVSGRDLDDFFRIWLYTPGKPTPPW
jgi:aminopeptidase N